MTNNAKFDPVERQAYEDSLKYYRDMKNVIDTAAMEAREEGKQEGIELGVMVKYFRKEFKLLSLKTSYAQPVSGNSVLN